MAGPGHEEPPHILRKNPMIPHALFTAQDRAAINAICLELTRNYETQVTSEFCALDGDEWAALCTPVDGIDLPILSIQTTRDPYGSVALIGSDGSPIEHGRLSCLDLIGQFMAARAIALT